MPGRAVTQSVTTLKRDLLLFDELLVMGLEDFLDPAATFRTSSSPALDALIADCEFLLERGVLHHVPAYRRELWDHLLRQLNDLGPEPFEAWAESDYDEDAFWDLPRHIRDAIRLASSAGHPAGRLSFEKPLPAGSELVIAYADRLLREDGAVPLLTKPVPSVTWRALLDTFIMPKNQDEVARPRQAVVEVVLKRLPIPGEDVPLEAVLDFAQDADTRRQVKSLHLWMKRMALQDQPLDELAVALDSILHEFEQYMQVSDMRARNSAFRLAVSMPLEVIGELLHLRPAMALDALFTLRTRRAEQLEAELSAPGHEVAYIATTRRTFGR